MTPDELLDCAHTSPIQTFEALQEALSLRQDPVRWDIFDESTYPPLAHENEAEMENGTQPPQKRKRRGRTAKRSAPAPPPAEAAVSPRSEGIDNTKRSRLGSPTKEVASLNAEAEAEADDRSSPKPSTSDDTVVLFSGGLIHEIVANTQNFNKLCEQFRDVHVELNEALQALDAALEKLQDMQRHVQALRDVQSEVRRITAHLIGT